MALMLLQLSLFAATFIQLTSSQNTYIYRHGDDTCISSCGRTEQMLRELARAVSQLQKDVNDLKPKNGAGKASQHFCI